MASKITGCPKKDEGGNHFVHKMLYNLSDWSGKAVLMCNSQGHFKPVLEAHAKKRPQRTKGAERDE